MTCAFTSRPAASSAATISRIVAGPLSLSHATIQSASMRFGGALQSNAFAWSCVFGNGFHMLVYSHSAVLPRKILESITGQSVPVPWF